MKQDELVTHLAEAANMSKTAAKATLDTLGNIVGLALAKGDEVSLPGIGKLSTRQRAARAGRNPKTGGAVQIAAKRVPHFHAAKALKDAVN